MSAPVKGRCLCGDVAFEWSGAPAWRGHCHCESCRRATSAPMTSFVCVRDEDLRWTGAAPAVYASSPGVERLFCGACGSPMGYRSEKRPGETDLYACSLTKPEDYEPAFHVFYAEKLGWLHIADDLPKHEGGGG